MPTEARPSAEAGMKACLVTRDGNAELSDQEKSDFRVISSFAELTPGGETSDEPAQKVGYDAVDGNLDVLRVIWHMTITIRLLS